MMVSNNQSRHRKNRDFASSRRAGTPTRSRADNIHHPPRDDAPHAEREEYYQRRGITLIMMLCVMAVIAIVSAGILAVMTSDRQVLQREAARVQAQWLATAGLERGAVRLLAEADYRGETWSLTAAELGGRDGGDVTIRVEPQVGRAGHFTISAVAEAGSMAGKQVRAARTITIDRQAAVRNSGEKP